MEPSGTTLTVVAAAGLCLEQAKTKNKQTKKTLKKISSSTANQVW